jgi:hypothetical protein
VEEVDDVAPLAKPGTWTYSPESDKEPGRPPVALYQCYPGEREGGTEGAHPSRAALYYITGKILNTAVATEEPGVDFDCGAMEGGPLRTHARLVVNPRLAVVIRTLDEPDGGSFSLVGMSPEEMRESQQRDLDLSQFCQWLSTGKEPDEGELFLAGPTLKHLWINRALFTRDDDQVLWKLTEGE